jgi:hypothetical protein
MQPIGLTLSRPELLHALQTLGVTRRKRFKAVLPVWLSHNPVRGELDIVEEGGTVKASVPAGGTWPPAGATVDLFMLKRALTVWPNEVITLEALEEAVVMRADRRQVRLNLLAFGPESWHTSS